MEFQHIDLDGFNRALNNFLEKREPDYEKRKAYWGKTRKIYEKHQLTQVPGLRPQRCVRRVIH